LSAPIFGSASETLTGMSCLKLAKKALVGSHITVEIIDAAMTPTPNLAPGSIKHKRQGVE
jgi:hypothetical protein